MIPHYPNNNTPRPPPQPLHHFVPPRTAATITESQAHNITGAAFLMSSSSSLDDYDARFFFHQQAETLEAVLRQPPVVVAAAAQVEQPWPEAAVEGPVSAAAARRRPFRTDRHSKIRTAQGVRDRRMRLSVGVARDFFALQDKLGFDKASKTVEWLLAQSRHAIDRLTLSDDAAVAPPPPAKEKGGAASSSSTNASTKDDDAPRGTDKASPPPAREIDSGGGHFELDWTVSGTPLPATTATTAEQPMDGLEYYYQYYNHLEEIMSCEPSTTDE